MSCFECLGDGYGNGEIRMRMGCSDKSSGIDVVVFEVIYG